MIMIVEFMKYACRPCCHWYILLKNYIKSLIPFPLSFLSGLSSFSSMWNSFNSFNPLSKGFDIGDSFVKKGIGFGDTFVKKGVGFGDSFLKKGVGIGDTLKKGVGIGDTLNKGVGIGENLTETGFGVADNLSNLGLGVGNSLFGKGKETLAAGGVGVGDTFVSEIEKVDPLKLSMAMGYIRRLSTEVLPYHLRSISDRLRQKAADELCETDETRETAIEELREKVKSEEHLQCPTSDEYLTQFLRARKFEVDKAFELLKNFYDIRRKHKDLYKDINFNGIQKVLKANFFGFLPFRDKEDCVVLLMIIGGWNPSEVSMKDIMRALTAGLIQAIDDPATQITGFKVIVDFKGFSMKHVRHLEPTYLYIMAGAMQNCFPGRFRAVHIINENFLFKYVWAVLKVVLAEKLKKRFHFHGSKVEGLKEHFPRKMLPKEYGGTLDRFDNKAWVEKMEEFEEMIMKSLHYGYHTRKESCLPGF